MRQDEKEFAIAAVERAHFELSKKKIPALDDVYRKSKKSLASVGVRKGVTKKFVRESMELKGLIFKEKGSLKNPCQVELIEMPIKKSQAK